MIFTDFSLRAPARLHWYEGGVRGIISGHKGDSGEEIPLNWDKDEC